MISGWQEEKNESICLVLMYLQFENPAYLFNKQILNTLKANNSLYYFGLFRVKLHIVFKDIWHVSVQWSLIFYVLSFSKF